MRKRGIYIKKINYKNVVKAILGLLTIPISLNVMIDVLHIKGIVSDGWINLLGIDKENGVYYGLSKVINKWDCGSVILWIIFFLFILIIAIQIIIFLKENRFERILLIEHSSVNQMNFKISRECKENYIIRPYRLNQYKTFNNNLPLMEKVNFAIAEMDSHIKQIKRNIEKGSYTIGYAGIANIPITFMLGYELGDENRKFYFHIYHGQKAPAALKDDNFHLLNEKVDQLPFKCETIQESNLNKEGKILLLIQLTQPIKEADYQDVLEENDYVIKYYVTDTIDYDIVCSSSQIDGYTDKILAEIAEIQKNPNIVQIKICVAASGAFIFALGTKFSKTQNKETVIFHYQKDTYPWGINVLKRIPVIVKEV